MGTMLWEIVVSADWRLMAITLVVGAFVVATVLIWNRSRRIWKRIRIIETRLGKMQNEITTILQLQVALITKRNANSRVEIDPRSTAVEKGGGEVSGQPMAPPPPPSQPRSVKAGKSGEPEPAMTQDPRGVRRRAP